MRGSDPVSEGVCAAIADDRRREIKGFLFAANGLNDCRIQERKTEIIAVSVHERGGAVWVYEGNTDTKQLASAFIDEEATLWGFATNLNQWVSIPGWKEETRMSRLKGVDAVGKFWVVTMPTRLSTVPDICFESSVAGMMLQARGGLDTDAILGIYRSEQEAQDVAERLIDGIRAVLGMERA